MEDTLRERIYFHVEIISVRVLILVLMEDTLRVRDQKTFVTWQQQTS